MLLETDVVGRAGRGEQEVGVAVKMTFAKDLAKRLETPDRKTPAFLIPQRKLSKRVSPKNKMPYSLRKAPGQEAFWVVNTESGKRHSIDPLPKSRAEAQMRALYAIENGYQLSKSRSRASRSRSRSRSTLRGGSRWVQDVVQHTTRHGAFARKAREHGMTTARFACHVLKYATEFSLQTRRQAQLFQNMRRSRSRACRR